MKKYSKKGFSLIEVLLAIVILGLIAAPIFQCFVSSMKLNNKSREIMAATDLSQSTLEYVREFPFEDCKKVVKGGAEKEFVGIQKKLTGTAIASERLEPVGFVASATNINNYTDENHIMVKLKEVCTDNPDSKVLYYGKVGSELYLLYHNVEFSKYKYDMRVHFEPGKNSGDTYFTYNVDVDVYKTSSGVEKLSEKLTTMSGTIVNKY